MPRFIIFDKDGDPYITEASSPAAALKDYAGEFDEATVQRYGPFTVHTISPAIRKVTGEATIKWTDVG